MQVEVFFPSIFIKSRFFFTVPTWRPAGIAAWNTSSTSILLSWQPLADAYYLHGILRGYVITYNRVDGLLPAEHITTSGSNLSLELGGLDEYVEYRFEVRAFTIKGAGPFTHINCLTDQDGKAYKSQLCFLVTDFIHFQMHMHKYTFKITEKSKHWNVERK